eukprot:SAG11_NODE_7543_length_1131_cov_1.265504_1_plen_112_part_00
MAEEHGNPVSLLVERFRSLREPAADGRRSPQRRVASMSLYTTDQLVAAMLCQRHWRRLVRSRRAKRRLSGGGDDAGVQLVKAIEAPPRPVLRNGSAGRNGRQQIGVIGTLL